MLMMFVLIRLQISYRYICIGGWCSTHHVNRAISKNEMFCCSYVAQVSLVSLLLCIKKNTTHVSCLSCDCDEMFLLFESRRVVVLFVFSP